MSEVSTVCHISIKKGLKQCVMIVFLSNITGSQPELIVVVVISFLFLFQIPPSDTCHSKVLPLLHSGI